MKTEILRMYDVYHNGDNATRPMALRLTSHPALLRLVGNSPLPCHALTGTPITAPSGASNARF